MARIQILGLIFAIICTSVVHCLTTTIKQRVVVGNKKFQCKFVLKHSSTDVNLKGSKLKCFPKKPKIKSLNVKLESADYFFAGKIKINPSRIQKMSCVKKPNPNQNVVISTNYPSKYPHNEDKEYPITVDEGHVISLVFTDLKIEADDSCAYDWITVVDADGTVLLDKTCGDTQPDKITSNTNSITIKFVSDGSVARKGFRAEYEQVYDNKYIGWWPGNFPLIISAPHGGSEMPSDYPDRQDGCCAANGGCKGGVECTFPAPSNCGSKSGCGIVTTQDMKTKEIAEDIYARIFFHYNVTPHMVITELHRTKLDLNREINAATNGNANAKKAYKDYHHYIKRANQVIGGPGLLVDIHGQGHKGNRTELGYKIHKKDLNAGTGRMDDCSFRALGNRTGMSLDDLLHGPNSFGALMEKSGFEAVPSPRQPSPGTEKYFDGGYITEFWGSRDGGSLDAVQIEIPKDVRYVGGVEMRKAFAHALADVIMSFMDKFYKK